MKLREQKNIQRSWRIDSIMVSICCITYNHEKYISDALNGFLMQETDFPFEILIHDDASTDNTADIIKKYEKKYPDIIKPIYQTENQKSKLGSGMNPAFNYPRAKGKYIAFCEGDDYWTDPQKLQKQVEFMEKNQDCGLVYTDIDFYHQEKDTFQRAVFRNGHKYRPKNFEDHLINKGYLAPPTWLMRKNCLGSLNLEISGTDGTFILMLEFFKNSKVYFLNDVTAVYRNSSGTVTTQASDEKRFNYMKGVFTTQSEFVEKYEVSDEVRKRVLTGGYFNLLPLAMKLGKNDFLEELQEYMKIQNINIKPVQGYIEGNLRFERIFDRLKKIKFYPFLKKFSSRYFGIP